jgi:hypothetical protein
MARKFPVISITFFTLGFASPVFATSGTDTNKFLKEFFANPSLMMDAPLFRQSDSETPKSLKSTKKLSEAELLKQKDSVRSEKLLIRDNQVFKLKDRRSARAEINDQNQVADLVDEPNEISLRIEDVLAPALLSATVPVQPWSDSYWPTFSGYISARYADETFKKIPEGSFKEFFSAAKSPEQGFESIFTNIFTPEAEKLAAKEISNLSPAEKYDLLMGDSKGTLSQKMWNDASSFEDAEGKVEIWMGLCHGWSAAAIQEQRPLKAVDFKLPNEQRLRFYPSDIKALATTLWANANVPSRFIGGRCDIKKAERDPESGRIVSDECFDVNPATFHLALVNQIGKSQRPFVMDATFDYEVWNYPVVSYSSTFFNPLIKQKVNSLAEGKINLEEWSTDPFKKFRSQHAVQVVGVATEVTYMDETTASHRTTDDARFDAAVRVTYHYDLEINAQGEIIGGEWYSNKHPDFLWVNAPDARATTSGDIQIQSLDWDANGGNLAPSTWLTSAKRMSKKGLPLETVVRALIDASRQ